MRRPGSLRLRLLLASAAAIALAMLLAVAVMGWMFSRHLQHNLARELIRDGNQLIANLHVADDGRIVLDAALDDPRFERPGSGRYWQISGAQHQERSLSLWDESLPAAPEVSGGWHTFKHSGLFSQHLLVAERTINAAPGQPPLRVQVAQDLAELHAARAEFRSQLALFLAILWLALVLAAWVQVDLGQRPRTRPGARAQTRRRSGPFAENATGRVGRTNPPRPRGRGP